MNKALVVTAISKVWRLKETYSSQWNEPMEISFCSSNNFSAVNGNTAESEQWILDVFLFGEKDLESKI